MHVYLLDLKSSSPLVRRMGLHKLEFFLMVMSELEDTYFAAAFTGELFREAISKLKNRAPSLSNDSSMLLTPESGQADQQRTRFNSFSDDDTLSNLGLAEFWDPDSSVYKGDNG